MFITTVLLPFVKVWPDEGRVTESLAFFKTPAEMQVCRTSLNNERSPKLQTTSK